MKKKKETKKNNKIVRYLKKIKKTLLIEIGILILFSIGFLIFDLSLELGKFHGLVFSLYVLYFSALILIVNLGISLVNIFMENKERSKKFLVSGIITTILGMIISYIGGRLFFL